MSYVPLTRPIVIRESITASENPTSGDISLGEIAINSADGNMFIKDTANNIVQINGGGGGGLGDPGANGVVVRTALDTTTARTITGTTDRVSVTNGTGVSGNPTLDIASTYAGQSSITTVGTITTGTWNGSSIGAAYGGTGATATIGSATPLKILTTTTTSGTTLAYRTLFGDDGVEVVWFDSPEVISVGNSPRANFSITATSNDTLYSNKSLGGVNYDIYEMVLNDYNLYVNYPSGSSAWLVQEVNYPSPPFAVDGDGIALALSAQSGGTFTSTFFLQFNRSTLFPAGSYVTAYCSTAGAIAQPFQEYMFPTPAFLAGTVPGTDPAVLVTSMNITNFEPNDGSTLDQHILWKIRIYVPAGTTMSGGDDIYGSKLLMSWDA